MYTIALQQVTSHFARRNARGTLEKPVHLKYIRRFVNAETFQELESACVNGTLFIWGAKLERIPQFEKMLPRRCLVLFRRGTSVYKTGVIAEWMVSLELAEYLWGTDANEETWGLVYFLTSVKGVSIPVAEVNKIIGRKANDNWQGLVAISSPTADRVIEFVKAKLSNGSGE